MEEPRRCLWCDNRELLYFPLMAGGFSSCAWHAEDGEGLWNAVCAANWRQARLARGPTGGPEFNRWINRVNGNNGVWDREAWKEF